MRVLVTGAAGYIGSVTTERLIEAGHEVVALDNLMRGHRAAVHPEAEFLELDLLDLESLQAELGARKLDAIAHFAALHLVPESVEKPIEYYRNNLIGGLNLLEVARDHSIPRFLFSSTAAVYGEPKTSPIPESAVKSPINPYGGSKWMVEQIMADTAARYDLHHVAFRFFNVAGATRECGEDHRPETHIIPIALQVLQGKREAFNIFGTDYPTPDGTAIRDYVHVLDLAEAHLLALPKLSDQPLGAINLGTNGGYSVREIASSVTTVLGKDLPTVEGPRRAGDPAALVADPAKAKELLDWAPTNSTLELMIGSAWEWMQAHPDGYGS